MVHYPHGHAGQRRFHVSLFLFWGCDEMNFCFGGRKETESRTDSLTSPFFYIVPLALALSEMIHGRVIGLRQTARTLSKAVTSISHGAQKEYQ